MVTINRREIASIVDYFVNGHDLIQRGSRLDPELYSINGNRMQPASSEHLKSFLSKVATPLSKIGRPSYLRNPDLFFALLQYGAIYNDSKNIQALVAHRNAEPAVFLRELLKPLTISEHARSLDERLETAMQSQFCDDDEELKIRATQRISIQDLSLEKGEEPLLYTKINHGYWEFLLNSYVDLSGVPESRYRDLSHSSHPASWRNTGFHTALLDAFLTKPSLTKVGVSLSAGERPFYQSTKAGLDPVARGALNGLLGFVEASGFDYPCSFFEGSAPRNLLKDQQYEHFFEDQLNKYQAILLMIPPPLRQLTFPRYKGDTYRLAIPGQVVHETYRVVIPTLLGLLEKLKSSHSNICIITQSAVLAPIAAIAVEHLTNAIGQPESVSFVDLGRVLDVARPETLRTYGSLAWVVESRLDEQLSQYLALDENLPAYGVCSLDG